MPRKLCEHCQRPPAVCLCPSLVNLQAPCRVLILQHPSEQKQALATVPLLQLCLSPLQVLVGENFNDHPEVLGLMADPQSCRVIYPAANSEEWDVTTTLKVKRKNEIKTLVVIDGTWRKAKRIWHLNPWMHKLPSVRLTGLGASQYQIRSSKVEGGVSTIEAVAAACEYLTGDGGFKTLLNPFHAMINIQIEKMGEEVFLAHYQKKDSN